MWINLLLPERIFSTQMWSKHVLLMKLIKKHGFLLPLVTKKTTSFSYWKRLWLFPQISSTHCQQRTIFSKSCLCTDFAPGFCLAVCLPLSLSLATSPSSSPSLSPDIAQTWPLFVRDWLLSLAWPWICSSSPTSFPLATNPSFFVYICLPCHLQPMKLCNTLQTCVRRVVFLCMWDTKLHSLVLLQKSN